MSLRCLLVLLLVMAAGCGEPAPASSAVVIENVTLIDGTDRGAVPGMTVVIEGDRIVAVGSTASMTRPAGGQRIDGTGQYLIPGLTDMHVHLHGYREKAYPLFLANGVTTIRNVGVDLDTILKLRDDVRSGRVLGPEIFTSGPVLDSKTVTTIRPTGRIPVPTAEAAIAAVDSLARAGVDLIKVHSQTPRAAYFAILREARAKGLFVAGHVPDSVSYLEAVDSGHRTIEHALGTDFANSSRAAAILAGYRAKTASLVAEMGERPRLGPIVVVRLAAMESAAMSYDSATAAAFARHAADRQVWLDPTLIIMETVYRANEPAIRQLPELEYVPKEARGFDEGIPVDPNPSAAVITEGRRKWEMVKRSQRELVRAGAKYVAGTDVPVLPAVPGFSLQRELGLLVEIGLTPLGAIQAGTRNAALAMGKTDRGTVEVGKIADLVLLRADPLAKIDNTREIETVIVRGRVLDRAALDRLLQDAKATANAP